MCRRSVPRPTISCSCGASYECSNAHGKEGAQRLTECHTVIHYVPPSTLEATSFTHYFYLRHITLHPIGYILSELGI